jgi:bifunctional N-acetylglucosamine-1-phosphate-uridyltransferase/glucosamine-1-phosphate-acetyltransferase GlmU-like protein
MSSPLTLVLWAGSGRIFEKDLLGRPVWQRTLEAAQPLRPRRTLLVSHEGRASRSHAAGPQDSLAGGVQRLSKNAFPRALSRLQGRLLVLPAEMPCVSARTLRRLVAASHSGVAGLLSAERESGATGLSCTASLLRKDRLGLRNGLESLGRDWPKTKRLTAKSEELLRVRTAADWAQAIQFLRRRSCERLLARGVLLDDPTTAHIDPDVTVGRGTRIRGWVVIEGGSRIGTDCDIGSFSHIVDSVIGSRTVLLDHCYVRSSRIGRRAQVGPFTHIRPESTVGDRAKVGNFVEMKKSSLGAGSKAPHLTYLGDAEVGRRVNVGAGTITCNYDGEAKHQTIIEDGAFIGSDVQLVAPVRVGRGAYVAAGSSIVEDVPAGSLAIARGRQIVKEGYARRRRARRRNR